MADLLNPQQFAAKIRAAHPGAYDDVPDLQLTTKVLAKYPEYHDMVQLASPEVMAAQAQNKKTAAGITRNQQSGIVMPPVEQSPLDYASALGGELVGAGKAVGKMAIAGPITAGVQSALTMPKSIDEMKARLAQAQDRGLGGRALDAAKALNPIVTSSPSLAQNVGGSVTNLAAFVAGGAKAAGEMLPPKAAPDIAQIVTDTVNPPPKSMPAFEKSVNATLPDVLASAKIDPAAPRASLGQAYRAAADKAKADYYQNIIDPAKDVPVSTNYIRNYAGGTIDHGTATVAQLDSRLAEINATLKPTYEKGGGTAQAALSAENKASLTSEAAAIRSAMNEAIAKQLQVPVEQVAAQRQKFGQMYDVADKVQLALNKERYAANQAAKQQPNLEMTLAGAANKVTQSAYRAIKGHPADAALREALNRAGRNGQP